jgi:hypothetical protein
MLQSIQFLVRSPFVVYELFKANILSPVVQPVTTVTQAASLPSEPALPVADLAVAPLQEDPAQTVPVAVQTAILADLAAAVSMATGLCSVGYLVRFRG